MFICFFKIVKICCNLLLLILVVECWGELWFVGFIKVWIFIIMGWVFFIEIIVEVLEEYLFLFLRNNFDGFNIFFKLLVIILNILILWVVLKWFFIECNKWWEVKRLFLKYRIVFIKCFKIWGFVKVLFLVIWLIINKVIFFCFVICINVEVYFWIWVIELGVEVKEVK